MTVATDRKSRRLAIGLIVLLLVLHGIVGRIAIVQKNATYDEPLYITAGWMIRYWDDYRADPEDGALFLRLSSAFLTDESLNISPSRPELQMVLEKVNAQWSLATNALYRTPGVDADKVVQRARLPFVLVSVCIGAMAAWLGWQLAGPVAGVLAALFFAADPNFLGHGFIVKNDVILAMFMLALALPAWRAGQRARLWHVVAAGALCGGAMAVKMSGVLLPLMLVVVWIVRGLLPQPWQVLRWRLSNRMSRLLAAGGMLLTAGAVAYLVLWACYGFRYHPAPDSQVHFNFDPVVRGYREYAWLAAHPDQTTAPTQAELDSIPLGWLARSVLAANESRLLPQAWLHGLLYTHSITFVRPNFLLGDHSILGRWYYFPLAMLFKTPTATLVALLLAMIVLIRIPGKLHWWDVTSLALIPLIYAGFAVTGNLNLGLRHILPVYPFLYVVICIGLVRLLNRWRLAGKWTIGLLAALLIAETASAFPDYIAFFNLPSGGSRGGLRLLSDSNLDWGQDLKTLRQWQERNPDETLFLGYFGSAPPDAYGIRCLNLPGGYASRETRLPRPDERCVVAVSATILQGTYRGASQAGFYSALLRQTPREVLGGTIYLYDWPFAGQAKVP